MFALSGASSIPGQMIWALQRLDIVSWINLGCQVIGSVISLLLVANGYGIYGLFLGMYIQMTINFTVTLLIVRRMYGWPFGNVFDLDRQSVVDIVKYGGWSQLYTVTYVIQSQSDKIVIGSLVGMKSVTAYDFGNKLALICRTFPISIGYAALPAIATISTSGDEVRLKQAYAKSSNMLAFITILLAAFIVASGEQLLRTWVGKSLENSATIMAMLLVSYTIYNLSGIGITVFRAQGKPYYEAYYGWLQLAVNIAITVVLGLLYGLMGIVLGTMIGGSIGSIFFIYLFHRVNKFSWWETVGSTLVRIVSIAAACGIGVYASIQVLPESLFNSRLSGLPVLAGLFGLYTILFLILSAVFVQDCVSSLGPVGRLVIKAVRLRSDRA
jgi:O-antigen/teichoic acid export membrane protein